MANTNDFSIFGWTLSKKKKSTDEITDNPSFALPENDDGSSIVAAGGGFLSSHLDIDGSIKNEADLIRRYRETALYAPVDNAIEDIINEAIVKDVDGTMVELDFNDLEDVISPNIQSIMNKEFKEVLRLLNFNLKGHDIFRRWYVDGRLYFHKLIDTTNVQAGIQEIRYIDPRKIKKVREVKKAKDPRSGAEVVTSIEEYYVFNEKGLIAQMPGQPGTLTAQGLKIAPEAITYVPSGYINQENNIVLSYLHKALKPANQLKMVEDALVIYRLSRAPDRRVFYIDIGNLPKQKAEQYMTSIMNKYRNKISYDANTGEIRDDKKYLSLMEDYWLPRREGGKGTEITTLEGGANLGQIEDIVYFQNSLYQSLNVPVSRSKPDTPFNFARGAEITRDEIKFSKFIDRIRNRFSELFMDLLKTNLIAKRIINEDDWRTIKDGLRFNYTQDIFYSEITDLEIQRNRFETIAQMQPFIGTYISSEWVRRHILRQTEEEMESLDKEMADDKEKMISATGMGMIPAGQMAPGSPGMPEQQPQDN